jgi:type II secretory pathway component PulJ
MDLAYLLIAVVIGAGAAVMAFNVFNGLSTIEEQQREILERLTEIERRQGGEPDEGESPTPSS